MTLAERRYPAKESPDQRLRTLATAQLGVASRAQIIQLGFSEGAIDRRLQRESWVFIYPGVYVVAGSEPTWKQRLLGAQIWAGEGTCVSHRSAAILWEIFDQSRSIVEITTTGRVRREGVVAHHRHFAPPSARRGPLRITTPTTTIVDLASVVEPKTLESALYSALRQRLTAIPILHDHIKELGRGYRGVSALRRVLGEAQGLRGIPESELETKFLDFLRHFNLPMPESQYIVSDGEGRFIARVDFAYPELKLAVEVDGYRFHSDRDDWTRDRTRLSNLIVVGWRVLHVTHGDVQQKSLAAAARIRSVIGGRQLSFRDYPR
ncbi:MAG: DUF559 domain-containing protein [Actinomycetota bacterium]